MFIKLHKMTYNICILMEYNLIILIYKEFNVIWVRYW